MKTSLELLSDIIHWLELFNKENPENETSLESFIIWLNSRLFAEHYDAQSTHGEDTLDLELSFLLALQNRHYKVYAKRALGESELSSPEGFSFLYHLSIVDSYRKMELIKMHHIEPPSGIEVLKRLLKKELIVEFDDPDDKRAKRIRISDTGRKEVHTIMPKMQRVFKSMTAEMSLNEKVHVVSFLRQMNDYHSKKTAEI
jgi:DNA-binding MarR family transcriptional regulator